MMDGETIPRVDIRVIRIRERRTIADPRIKALVMRAVEATQFPGTTPKAFYDELVDNIAGDLLGVFVGLNCNNDDYAVDSRGALPCALAVVWLPWSQFAMGPHATLVYSEDRELSKLIGARVREWVKEAGYDRVLGVNMFHNEQAFFRVFRHVGTPRAIGTLIEVKL